MIATEATLDGSSDQPGYLQGYGVIDAAQVRQLAPLALRRPLGPPPLTTDGELRYQPSAAHDRFIRCRDLTCRWANCGRPAWRADIDHTVPFDHRDPAAGGPTSIANNKCYCRLHHLIKTFLTGVNGWHDEQLPDGTVILTSPTGRRYVTTPAGYDLFPQLARAGPVTPSGAVPLPTPPKRNHQADARARLARARARLNALRPVNAEQRRINRGRRQEIDRRWWRNNMRRNLLILKGGRPSTSPWCPWVNDPKEPDITADWLPPPPPAPHLTPEEPPF